MLISFVFCRARLETPIYAILVGLQYFEVSQFLKKHKNSQWEGWGTEKNLIIYKMLISLTVLDLLITIIIAVFVGKVQVQVQENQNLRFPVLFLVSV